MKKLFSLMVVTIVCVLALTVVAGATDNVYYLNDEGLIDISYDLGADKTGSMYGLVVIEAEAVPASFSLSADDIRHIDQANANGEVVSFDGFTPKALETSSNEYLVYIGGDGLNGATRLGKVVLGEAPELFEIVFIADGVVVETIEAYEGSTFSQFPAVPAKTGYTGVWEVTEPFTVTESVEIEAVYTEIVPESVTLNQNAVELTVGKTVQLTETVLPAGANYTAEWSSNAASVAKVENGLVEALAEGEATITVTVAPGLSATCVVTVVAAPDGICGDVNDDGNVNRLDGTFLARNLAKWKVYDGVDYSVLPSEANSDINADGNVNRLDGTALARNLAKWKVYDGVDYSVLPVVSVVQ